MNSRARNISDRCADGHSVKHIDEFNYLGVETPEQYKEHINNVLESRETECFSAYSTEQTWRQADVFYHEPTNTLVVDPENPSQEPTAYQPKNGKNDFEEKHKEAERIEDRPIEKYNGMDELEQAKQSKVAEQNSTLDKTQAVENNPVQATDQPTPEVSPIQQEAPDWKQQMKADIAENSPPPPPPPPPEEEQTLGRSM